MVSNTRQLGPLLQKQRIAVVGYTDMFTPVAILRLLRRPSAIRWPVSCLAFIAVAASVAAVRVFPVDAVADRGRDSNVRQERLKRVAPVCTDDNAAATIEAEIVVILPVAAIEHASPDSIFPRCRLSTVPKVVSAATASGATNAKFLPLHNLCLAAFAKAIPSVFGICERSAILRPRNNGKTAENLAGQILRAAESSNSVSFSHDVNLHPGLQMVRADGAFPRATGSLHFSRESAC